ncbi:hypothetical protein TUM4438_09350 [Shewanella sairae]|uniref:Uncharacterized protein n=1 Tax=Shewanella sairae TaxID=190310 RepID=A0ABQ4P527_9GAMM|nr:hypothetical protein [Shewanella sairae]MCL1129746.1 hypothetical protein [Shewanella sairae]GIU42538.1 hypothetical protein TUM4438_09350 [Shewanella sairae]
MGFFISEKFSRVLIFIGVSLLFLFIISFTYKAILFDFNVSIKTDVFGQFGDIVGGVVGSLWALAGVILFYSGLKEQRHDIQTNRDALKEQIKALNYQKEEMALQREEYAMARRVFEQQSDTLKEQSKTSRIQQFESNFYSLLNIYIGIKSELIKEKHDFINDINNELLQCDLSESSASEKMTNITIE